VAGTVLIVSHLADVHATEVLRRLRQRGADAVLFDTGRIPRETVLTIEHGRSDRWAGTALVDGRRLDLAAVRAAWWRRPLPFHLHAEIGGADDRGFALGEAAAAVAGLWSCLDAEWINDPGRDEAAGRKAWQLKLAAGIGLRIPRTCITNDPDRARAFAEEEGAAGTVYKAFSATERTWRETRVLRPEEVALLDAVRYAPVIFQEYIPAVVDLRVTIVGEDVFAAEIHSQTTEYKHDFRMAMHDAAIRSHTLPDAVVAKLQALMATLGLVYGALDLRLTPEGDYVFLEINPAGQWLFVEHHTGQPISDAIADALVARAGR
jgi:hypothetical protein